MDTKQKLFFEALHKDRCRLAESLESHALQGVKKSVVEKYSDQAHFIYELLQNADDANATEARFELAEDKLIFAHNGTRRFRISDPVREHLDALEGVLGDINSIASVGASNKQEQTTIGKFGVGFKAVFQYTMTPHIYDPDVAFKIERFIVPTLVQEDYPGRGAEETLFVFPFDHVERRAEESYEDILAKLHSLDYPLLFLPNLRSLSFEVSNARGSYGRTIEESCQFGDVTAEFVHLTKTVGESSDGAEDRLWLFSRKCPMGYVHAVGFFVNAMGQLVPKSPKAFCFFSTRETTELNFIIHAPFLLTDSREGIKAGARHNRDMIAALARLSADSLVLLRDIGQRKGIRLIDDAILAIIPYDPTRFSHVNNKNRISFEPFYTAIRDAFQNEAIIPCREGYVSSSHAYWADVPKIAEVFSKEQLAVLARNEEAQWVFTSFGRQDTRRSKNAVLVEYVDSITEGWLDEKDILSGWRVEGGAFYPGVGSAFIEAQPKEWVFQFYAWIAETSGRRALIRQQPIFLNQDGKAVAAFDDKDRAILFLPTEGGSSYETVHKSLVDNEEARELMYQLGIHEPSLRDEIHTIILPRYTDGSPIDAMADFRKFFRYYQQCSRAKERAFLDSIRDCRFVLSRYQDDKTPHRSRAFEIYFPWKPLLQWFLPKQRAQFLCLDVYLECIGKDSCEELLRFFTELGVKDVPRVLSRELDRSEALSIKWKWPYSTKEQKWIDKDLDGCREIMGTIVKGRDLELSLFVWSQLLRFVEHGYMDEKRSGEEQSLLYGRYEYFHRKPKVEWFSSREIRRLTKEPWLANRQGKFVSAGGLTIETIHPRYAVESREALVLLQILGIKEAQKREIDVLSLASQLDLSLEEHEQALREFSARKKTAASVEEEPKENPMDFRRHVERITKEISRSVIAEPEGPLDKQDKNHEEMHLDGDEYSKPAVDIKKKIDRVKEQAERDIREIARLQELEQRAKGANKYSYAWFCSLLELESLTSSGNNANSREISISFSKVEREEDTARTLVLKHPNRFIPQFMEDLADIPLELHFTHQSMVKVAVEVVNVKSYTLRAKLRSSKEIEGMDLSLVREARIEARNPVFLIEELRRSFLELGATYGYSEDFNMQGNLCKNIEFVFGPPGTGKTTHLALHAILPIMKGEKDKKILVLTPTNKAGDVIVRRVMELSGEDPSYRDWLIRFGATNDSVIEERGVFRDRSLDIGAFSRCVLVTTIARFPYDYFLGENGRRIHLDAMKWDYIIMDEASMIPLVNMVYPLYKKTPEKFIIAGDPFQIEPITAVDVWKQENIYKMVRLRSFINPQTIPHSYRVELLKTQYRSTPSIGEVFSKLTYGGVLQHHRKGDNMSSLLGDVLRLGPLNIIKFPVSKFESIYRPKRLQGKSVYQVYSALFAFEFVKFLSSKISGVKENLSFSIGLIAPYRAQADLLDKLMTTMDLPKNVSVQVGTIHGFQGDECDMILALFNPPPSISSSPEMFLNKLSIVNVSISRARDFLFVLMPDDDTENVGNLLLVKRVERLCKDQTKWVEYKSQDLEELMFGKRTYLEENSFSTSHQLVNVYKKPEKRYEVRSEDSAVDLQIHE